MIPSLASITRRRVSWGAALLVSAVATVAVAQETESRRLVQMRVIHASANHLAGQEIWVDPSLQLIRSKLMVRFPYQRYVLLQSITQALGLNEKGAVVLPDRGGSVEIVPTAFLGPRMRMHVRVVPASITSPVDLAAETNPSGTLVIGGVPHADGTLLILIQQQQSQAATGAGTAPSFRSTQRY